MKKIKDKIKQLSMQCASCVASFQIWMDNARLPEDKQEKIDQHFLSYCPACSRVDEK